MPAARYGTGANRYSGADGGGAVANRYSGADGIITSAAVCGVVSTGVPAIVLVLLAGAYIAAQ